MWLISTDCRRPHRKSDRSLHHLTHFLLPNTDISASLSRKVSGECQDNKHTPDVWGTGPSTLSCSSAQLMFTCQFFTCPRILSSEFLNTDDNFLLDRMFGIWALFFFKYRFYSKYEFISSGSYFSSFFSFPKFLHHGPSCLPVAGPINIMFLQSCRGGAGRGGDYLTCWRFLPFFPIQGTLQGIYNELCSLQHKVPS